MLGGNVRITHVQTLGSLVILAMMLTGNHLPVDLALSARTLEIIIDDTTAIYPIQVSSSINGLSTSWDWKVEGSFSDTEFGFALSIAGNVNRDGYSDVIIGAPKYDGGQTNEGRASLFLGSPKGLSIRPLQTRFNSSVPIAPFGKSDSLTGLRFYTSLWSPFGRIGLQQWVEYKPLGEVFNELLNVVGFLR